MGSWCRPWLRVGEWGHAWDQIVEVDREGATLMGTTRRDEAENSVEEGSTKLSSQSAARRKVWHHVIVLGAMGEFGILLRIAGEVSSHFPNNIVVGGWGRRHVYSGATVNRPRSWESKAVDTSHRTTRDGWDVEQVHLLPKPSYIQNPAGTAKMEIPTTKTAPNCWWQAVQFAQTSPTIFPTSSLDIPK